MIVILNLTLAVKTHTHEFNLCSAGDTCNNLYLVLQQIPNKLNRKFIHHLQTTLALDYKITCPKKKVSIESAITSKSFFFCLNFFFFVIKRNNAKGNYTKNKYA